MKILKEIKDSFMSKDESKFETREASRAVVFDENNLISLLFVSKNNYHKLPGGGIEVSENKVDTLIREIKEEIGSEIEITGEIGEIIEFRSKYKLKQISYCYLGKIISKGNSELTKAELDNGFKLIWITLDDAIKKIKSDKPNNYTGLFIQKRDLVFLQKAKEILSKS